MKAVFFFLTIFALASGPVLADGPYNAFLVPTDSGVTVTADTSAGTLRMLCPTAPTGDPAQGPSSGVPLYGNKSHCLVAETDGLHLIFVSTSAPFAPPALTCVDLGARSDQLTRFDVTLVRAGGASSNVHCDFETAEAFVESFEAAPFVAKQQEALIDLLIPWSTAIFDVHAAELIVCDPFQASDTACSTGATLKLKPNLLLSVGYPIATHVSLDRAATPVPQNNGPNAALFAAPDFGQAFNADFGTDQTKSAIQSAFANIAAVAPKPPATPAPIPLSQNIQNRVSGTFTPGFAAPLSSDAIVGRIASTLPYSLAGKVTQVGSAYAYTNTQDDSSIGLFYDTISPGVFTDAVAATFAVFKAAPQTRSATAAQRSEPTPEPSASPPSYAAPYASPAESALLNAPIARLSVMKTTSANTDPTTNALVLDNTLAFTAEANLYSVLKHGGASYAASGLQLFGGYQEDRQTPNGMTPELQAVSFAGESASGTRGSLATARTRQRVLHWSETIAVQQTNAFYNPMFGATTPTTPLSGPLANVSAATSCLGSLLCSGSFTAFRLSNVQNDIAAMSDAGIALTTPGSMPLSLSADWHLRSDSQRIAALEAGAVAAYTPAFVENTSAAGIQSAVRSIALGLSNVKVTPSTTLALSAVYQHGIDFACTAAANAATCANVNLTRGGINGDFTISSLHVGFDSGNFRETDPALGGADYAGSYFNAPESQIGYLTYGDTKFQALIAYANANFGGSLPEKGKTFTSELRYGTPLGQTSGVLLAVTAGYFNQRSEVNAAENKGGYLVGAHLIYNR